MTTLPPSLDTIEELARTAISDLPPQFAVAANTLVLRVMEFAPDELLAEIGIEEPFELTGLYTGIPLTEKSSFDQPTEPDAIWLFRRPILDEWIARGDVDLSDLVTHVTVHELAHHFGWTDADIARIDRWWE
ncbi:metallopeptidase family protein [Aliiroseovarius sp. PTFE2010]|uniref:metallopeptidase family protein n=1 Tax=Aliiroseovarius sp. PTFE2010 TaxID=3417190 RepID=UPI003CEDD437